MQRKALPPPLSDPTFGELCMAKQLPEARGLCYRVHGRLVCLPSFLVIGFTKAGTSVFFQYAAQHRLIRAARLKEPAYLGADAEAQASAVDETAADVELDAKSSDARNKTLAWYLSLFTACAHCERGEATPGYAWREHSAAAAHQARLLLGSRTRLVMLVREPVRRAVSHFLYFHQRRQARFGRVANLTQALRGALAEFERCVAQLNGWQHQCTYRSGRRDAEVAAAAIAQTRPQLWRLGHGKTSYELLQGGLYVEHLRTWRAHFAAEAILVLDAATLLDAPLRAMRRFERHLGLPHHRNYSLSASVHVLGGRRGEPRPGVAAEAALATVDFALRDQLRRFFTPFNRRLRRQFGVGAEWES